jgi:hypothetical protein
VQWGGNVGEGEEGKKKKGGENKRREEKKLGEIKWGKRWLSKLIFEQNGRGR